MFGDWEYSDNDCPKCQSQMAWRRCNQCEDGYVEDDDGINGRSMERCDNCNGDGSEEWCRECGWDDNFNCFLTVEDERAFLEKQFTSADSGNPSGRVESSIPA